MAGNKLALMQFNFFYCSLLANIRCICGVRLLKKDPIKVVLKIGGIGEEKAEGGLI